MVAWSLTSIAPSSSRGVRFRDSREALYLPQVRPSEEMRESRSGESEGETSGRFSC